MTQEALKLALDALEKLACLGNGQSHGNSIGNDIAKEAIAAIKETLAQEQEPVADDFFKMIADRNPKPFPLPQRTWVGLTDVEIDYLLGSTVGENEETHISFARAIESKLKERNT